MKTFYLYPSSRKDKKYMLAMPDLNHTHHFGQRGYKDYTLMHDKNSPFYESDENKREKTKKAYLARHKKDPKGIHSPSTLSDMILWSAPTIQKGIKNYEKKYKVKVIYNDKSY